MTANQTVPSGFLARLRAFLRPLNGESPESHRRQRLWAEWLATALLSSLLLGALVYTGATRRLDNAIYDVALRLRPDMPRPDIVIVAVDRASLQEGGEWPWPRKTDADLIAAIARDHPKALACHFLFLLPSPVPGADRAVHDAMIMTRTYLGLPPPPLANSRPGVSLAPVATIASAAAGLSAGDFNADSDGIVRRADLFEGASVPRASRMVLQMANLVGKGPTAPPAGDAAGSRTGLASGQILIPFVSPRFRFTRVSAVDVLRGRVAADLLKNKFVLLGTTEPALLDDYPTPTSNAGGMPSVEVDANVLNALLNDRRIVPAPPAVVLAMSLALIWLLLVALVRLGPRDNLWLALAMSGLPLAGAVFGVALAGVWLPPVAFLVTLALVLPYWGWRRLNAASAYFAEELRALERNVGASVLAESRSQVGIGGDVVLQQMTLLEETKRRISDLRRFVADMLANFPDPVLVVDRSGRILTINQAARDFAARLGASAAPNAPIEPILARIAAFGKDPRPMWPPPQAADGAGGGVSARPLTGVAPEGRAYELRYTATRDAGDQPTGWIVHLADITPLVTAMRKREEALQLLSHDMRSPQSAILATLDHPDYQDAPVSLRQRIERHARRTLDLADAFVRLAKAESAEYEFEPIDLFHVLQDAADAVWPLAQAADVRVQVRTEAGEADEEIEYVVLADRGLLTRALVNLLDNAVKFSPPGRAVVCSLTYAPHNGGRGVACQIADRAGGIARADLVNLFQKFGRSRDSLSGAPGVGLGLALVHTVVTRHEGVITCDSVVGEGTVFTITLPLCDEGEEEIDRPRAVTS